jgi:hypothetical protein
MTQQQLYGPPADVPHAKGSRTSRMAAEAISREPAKRLSKLMGLLEAYVEAGARGLNDAEASAATGWPRSSICSLRANLIKRGWVMDGYTRRKGPYQHQQTVYVATTAGREASR